MNDFRYTLVNRTLPGDLHTPVSAYLRLRDASTGSILMESSDYHGGQDARSFIALDPLAEILLSGGKAGEPGRPGGDLDDSYELDDLL